MKRRREASKGWRRDAIRQRRGIPHRGANSTQKRLQRCVELRRLIEHDEVP